MVFSNLKYFAISALLTMSYVLPISVGPIYSFVFEALAFTAWLLISLPAFGEFHVRRGTAFFYATLLLLIPAAATVVALVLGQTAVWQLSLFALYYLFAAWVCLVSGRGFATQVVKPTAANPTHSTPGKIALGIACAAICNAVIGVLQYWQLALPWGLSFSLGEAGRVFGNLRQPNHFALLMAWGVLALIGFHAHRVLQLRDGGSPALHPLSTHAGKWERVLPIAQVVSVWLLSAAVALSGSRMGIGLLWLIGILVTTHKVLPIATRMLAASIPVAHSLTWAGLTAGAQYAGLSSTVAARGIGDPFRDSRFSLWVDGITLVTRDLSSALWGYGHGMVDFTLGSARLSPLLHTNNMHNIVFQFAVEFGLPMALLWSVSAALLLWHVRSLWMTALGRLLVLALVVTFIHSLLEYPLWYAHFLLPFAAAVGVCAGFGDARNAPASVREATAPQTPRWQVLALPVLLALIPTLAYLDYRHVIPMYEERTDRPLMQRVADGYRSTWFRYLVDYGAFTGIPVTAESAPQHYSLGMRVRYIDYGEQVAFQLMLAAAYSGHWTQALEILKRLQTQHPSALAERLMKVSPESRAVYAELLKRQSSAQ